MILFRKYSAINIRWHIACNAVWLIAIAVSCAHPAQHILIDRFANQMCCNSVNDTCPEKQLDIKQNV